MLEPDNPDKLDDEWILAQIMVLFWAGKFRPRLMAVVVDYC
jgi:hypothetical protein